MNIRLAQAKTRINRNNNTGRRNSIPDGDEDDEDDTKVFRQEQFDVQYAELLKEKQVLEKVCSYSV